MPGASSIGRARTISTISVLRPLRRSPAQIVRSHGPSGPNVEYVLRLAEALRAMGVVDAHVFAVERLVIGAAAP